LTGKQAISNIIYATLLLALAVILLFLSNRQPFGKRNSSFAVEEGAEISLIEFAQGREKLSLEKNNDDIWTVNGNYEARVNGITFIEKILTGLEIKSTVSEEIFTQEIIAKNIEPIKVRVFSGNKTIGGFLVYKTRSNVYGNIMKMTPKSKPFIVNVPGYDIDIGSAFTLNENYWRPYTLFSSLPAEITKVELINGADSLASYRIVNNFQENIVDIKPTTYSKPDTALIKRYLTYFSMVPFESWALNIPPEQIVEITGRRYIFKLTVNENNGTTTVVTFWPMEVDGKLDTDRLWARINDNNNLVIVKYFDIDPVIKKRSYFFVN
jgi:hypothetical protein